MSWEISAVLLLDDKRGMVGGRGGAVALFSSKPAKKRAKP
jgi:hypothetical protein